jgi:hypothetical protein
MAIRYAENYYTIRQRYPLIAERSRGYLDVASPSSGVERTYQDLVSEANSNFFHREYQIALQNYLDLRHRILVQSDPQMPTLPGSWYLADILDVTKVDWKRIAELGRIQVEKAAPHGPVPITLVNHAIVTDDGFSATPGVGALADVGVFIHQPQVDDPGVIRDFARSLAAAGDIEGAARVYDRAASGALEVGEQRLTAEILAECGAVAATFASSGGVDRVAVATSAFRRAREAFAAIGDTAAVESVDRNMSNLVGLTSLSGSPGSTPIGSISVTPTMLSHPLPTSGSVATEVEAADVVVVPAALSFVVPTTAGLLDASAVLAEAVTSPTEERSVGFLLGDRVVELPVEREAYLEKLETEVYARRVGATTLEEINFFEIVGANFVAYVPHLFFFVLPVAIGDTYAAMGMYQAALDEYSKALAYTFINTEIEAPFVWVRMAQACVGWGDRLFRQQAADAARQQYEKVIASDLSVPADSPLYRAAPMAAMSSAVAEVAKELSGQPHAEVSPKVAELVTQAYLQLRKIAGDLNFFGLGPDDYPVFRFKYLQAAANYMADNAVQTERTFVSFRSTAESQKLERIQLESAFDINQAALAVEQTRLVDAALEVEAAQEIRELAELRRDHSQASLDDWNTLGRELASVNAALSWASNAANDQDITYTGVRYNGQRHDFDTDVEEFYDVVGEWRENLNFEIQQRRLERSRQEADAELAIAQTRQNQAEVRQEVQQLSVAVAEKRLQGAQDMLDYASDRMFDEDLWFRLAAELQDLSRRYLDMATYAALLMERAYELEFDRKLGRVRQDYGIGGVEGLLGGDYLKRDIAEFTFDYLQNAQRKNPIRVTISLRDEFPQAFNQFTREGIMSFTTDLEIFDRLYPGTCRRKLKKVELFVEGLVPLEGIAGLLAHSGVSWEWRHNGGWAKHIRVVPPQRMVLSSYEFRRDYTVFQPSEAMLDPFENLGPQGNWTLELPRSANNIDYQAISDIKLALYFDADHDESLRAHVRSTYPEIGGHSLVLSSRFHFPDQYFRMELDRRVAFELHASRFAYNEIDQKLQGLGVRLLSRTGGFVEGADLTITRASDGAHVDDTTDTQGTITGSATTMAPFSSWKGEPPIDTFTVAFGADVDISEIGDVQLFVDYAFSYRHDGSLS